MIDLHSCGLPTRLKKLFRLAYPLSENQRSGTDALQISEQVLRDKFIEGLPFEIRHKIKLKEFEKFEDLVKFTNKLVVGYKEKREKEERKIISQIHGLSISSKEGPKIIE